MTTIVCQSYRDRDVPAWIATCLASVRDWTERQGWAYCFIGDALFERLPDWYRQKTRERPVVATDLARLLLAQECLQAGYERAIWLDADVLVFAPARLAMETPQGYAFGREVWIQRQRQQLRAYRQVHNAVCAFARDNPFLAFYIHACQRVVRRHQGNMVPQLVGPKLLSALDSWLALPALPEVALFSPLVNRDVLAGGGPALSLHRQHAGSAIGAANLSASTADRDWEGIRLTAADYDCLTARLLARGEALVNGSPDSGG